MMHSREERRQDARLPLSRPVKIQCQLTGRYLTGYTQNLSPGGAMMQIDHPSLLVPGQRVKIGIAHSRQDALLRGEQMHPATVVRSVGLGGMQTVALRFDQKQALAISA